MLPGTRFRELEPGLYLTIGPVAQIGRVKSLGIELSEGTAVVQQGGTATILIANVAGSTYAGVWVFCNPLPGLICSPEIEFLIINCLIMTK